MEFDDLVAAYAASTDRLQQAIADIGDDLDMRPADGWSARMIVHHLADAETNAYVRLRRLLAEEPGTAIQGFDESAWANCPELGYDDLPIAHSHAVLTSVRAASLDVLYRLSPADLDRAGVHTEGGHYTLRGWITHHTAHANDHATQIEHAIGREA